MIQHFADLLVYDFLEFNPKSALGSSVNFFVYDSLKILFLLLLITLIMGIINAYFPIDRLKNFLTQKKLFGFQYVFAAIFGAITPFCSCSSVPLFIGFVKGGIPLGVTLSFLITSPLVNEVAIALFLGSFGWKATLIYAGSGIILGIIGGAVLERFKLERYLTPWVQQIINDQNKDSSSWKKNSTPFLKRLPLIWTEAWGIVKNVTPYVLLGIGIGAIIHGYVPQGYFEQYLSKDNLFAVPIAVIIGVPVYANAAGVIPIIQVFVSKGIPLGTGIAFMMASVGLSLPEATMLKKVMTWKLIGIFFGVTTLFIILSGYLFNILL